MRVVEKEAVDASKMLEHWKIVYMEVREKIEIAGKAARWEFDKKKLFGASDYIASVCKDIYEIVNVINLSINLSSTLQSCLSLLGYLRFHQHIRSRTKVDLKRSGTYRFGDETC